MERTVLGDLEQLVMLAVLRVGVGAYGVTVQQALREETGRDLTLGTVHKTLARLEDKGLVASRTGEPTPVRGGRRRRHFEVTAAGRAALRGALDATRRLARGLDLGWDAP